MLALAALVHLPRVWIAAIAAAVLGPLWLATKWFARLKRGSDLWWMRYL